MLNRSKDFGEVFGHWVKWRYEQDGDFFDAQGFQVDPKSGQRLECDYQDVNGYCGFVANSAAGLESHKRKHSEVPIDG